MNSSNYSVNESSHSWPLTVPVMVQARGLHDPLCCTWDRNEPSVTHTAGQLRSWEWMRNCVCVRCGHAERPAGCLTHIGISVFSAGLMQLCSENPTNAWTCTGTRTPDGSLHVIKLDRDQMSNLWCSFSSLGINLTKKYTCSFLSSLFLKNCRVFSLKLNKHKRA